MIADRQVVRDVRQIQTAAQLWIDRIGIVEVVRTVANLLCLGVGNRGSLRTFPGAGACLKGVIAAAGRSNLIGIAAEVNGPEWLTGAVDNRAV